MAAPVVALFPAPVPVGSATRIPAPTAALAPSIAPVATVSSIAAAVAGDSPSASPRAVTALVLGKTNCSEIESMTGPIAMETRWRVRFGFWPGRSLVPGKISAEAAPSSDPAPSRVPVAEAMQSACPARSLVPVRTSVTSSHRMAAPAIVLVPAAVPAGSTTRSAPPVSAEAPSASPDALTGAPGKTKFSDSDSMTAPMAVETRWRVRFGFWPGSCLMDMGYYPCAIAMPPLMSPVEVAPARQNTNRHALV